MTDSQGQRPYAESRTAKGDKWYKQINDLKVQVDQLKMYSEAQQAFRAVIEDALVALPMNNSREIARAELMEFCSNRMSHAQTTIQQRLRRVNQLESEGVPE